MMEKALSWEIENLSNIDVIESDPFLSGGCKWVVRVFPREILGSLSTGDLSLFLHVWNPESLKRGWERRASYCFVLLNQSGKELYRSPDECRIRVYSPTVATYWGYSTGLILTKLQEQGLLENDKLTVEVYINVVEVVVPPINSSENDILDNFHGSPQEMMEKALSWEIENLSNSNDVIESDPFLSGGCKWFVRVFPRKILGSVSSGDLSLFLRVWNPESLKPGWERRASYCFVLLNQSGKELYRSPDECRIRVYSPQFTYWGYSTGLILTKLQEQGLLEIDKLTIEVYINVVEVVVPPINSSENDILDNFHGSPQAASVRMIYAEHPDFALDFKPENQEVNTAYVDRLLGLIETLSKSPRSLSVTELTNAQSELGELTEAGFKLGWLNTKLEEVSLERKKALSDGSWVQQLEERVKTVELTVSDLKVELDKEKKIKSAAATKLSSFEVIDFLIKRFFLACFSISKY